MRSLLYMLARVLGDISAARRGTTGKRLGRRLTGKFVGRLLSQLWR